jgi:hypothetical protein
MRIEKKIIQGKFALVQFNEIIKQQLQAHSGYSVIKASLHGSPAKTLLKTLPNISFLIKKLNPSC